MSEWTRERVAAILEGNKKLQMEALMALYRAQTPTEQSWGATVAANGQGFNKFDAEFLTSLAQQLETKGYLSGKQMQKLKDKLPRYWRQIVPLLSPLAEQELRQQDQAALFAGTW